MKKSFLIVLLSLFSFSVYAQDAVPEISVGDTGAAESEDTDFKAVDGNQDGVLSIEEAEMALPELSINDVNGDELLNQSEAEAAVPELQFEGEYADKEFGLIREPEFKMIVAALNGY